MFARAFGQEMRAIRWICFLLWTFCAVAYAQDDLSRTKEYALKASWLTKFIKYMEWPPGHSDHTITIAIVGNDPFGNLFTPVEGQLLMGRKLVIKRLGSFHEGMQLGACDLLFIAGEEKEHAAGILALIGHRPVLTVSEYRGFADDGGMINFLPVKRDRIRYEVNQGRAEQRGLRVTSPLLRYADRVITLGRSQ